MKLIALLQRVPESAPGVEALARALGWAVAEARMRLAPEPPALLARLPPDKADALVATLHAAGLPVLAIDEAGVARDWVQARTFSLGANAVFTARSGASLELPWSEVAVVLRAASSSRSRTEQTEKTKKLDVGMAVLTSGLKMTRAAERTVRSESSEMEQVIYVFARDGRGAVLRELSLDFSCLGPAMQPVRIANMMTLAKLLKERAPGAFHDDRLVRLGTRPLPFVLGADIQVSTKDVSQTKMNTAGGLDLLAECLRRGVAEGLVRRA